MSAPLAGPVGAATPCAPDPARPHAVVSWFLDLPAVDPLHHFFVLYAVGLAPDPASPAPRLLNPRAQFEIGLLALDPHAVPTSEEPGRWQPLLPARVVFQFAGLSRDGVAELTRRVALWLVSGSRWPVTAGNLYEQRGWAFDLTQELKLLSDCPIWTAASPAPAQAEPAAGPDLPGGSR